MPELLVTPPPVLLPRVETQEDEKPAGGGLGTKRRLGGLLGSAFKRKPRGIVVFPRLFEGDVG